MRCFFLLCVLTATTVAQDTTQSRLTPVPSGHAFPEDNSRIQVEVIFLTAPHERANSPFPNAVIRSAVQTSELSLPGVTDQ